MKNMKIEDVRSSFDEEFEINGNSNNENIILIDIDDINKNKKNHFGNFDTDDEIEILADRIYEMSDEHQPLNPLVVYFNNSLGAYTLLSGEKRYKACLFNLKRYDDAPKSIRCIVVESFIHKDMTDEEKKLARFKEYDYLVQHNKQRDLTDEQLYEIAYPYMQQYKLLEESGNKPAGEKRRWLQARLPQCGIRKAERLFHIFEGKKTSPKLNEETNMEDVENTPSDTPKAPKQLSIEDQEFVNEVEYYTKRIEDATGNAFPVVIKKKSITFKFKNIEEFHALMHELHFDTVLNEE